MSAINHALRTIQFSIPHQVLQAAMSECKEFSAISLEEFIRITIINARVLKDIDLVNGENAFLPVNDAIITSQGYTETSAFYTDEYLQGREIISAIMYHASSPNAYNSSGYITTGSYAPDQPNAPGSGINCNSQYGVNRGNALGKALTSINQMNTPYIPNINSHLTVVAKNTILMRYTGIVSFSGAFEVQLSNDPYLNNLSPRSIPTFSELCVLAVKSFIYNKLYIYLGQAALYNGQALNQQNDYVQQLSNIEEEYQRFLREEWSRVSYMNDSVSYHNLIKMQINPFN